MTVAVKGFYYEGLSSDTKPTTNVPTNTRFIETDTGNEYSWNGSSWAQLKPTTLSQVASANYRNTNDAEKTTISATYVKLKEMKLNAALAGCRVHFQLKTDGGVTVYGRVYKNGVAVGAEHSTTSAIYVDFTDDLSGLVANDLIQIYAHGNGVLTVFVDQERLGYDRIITAIGGDVLASALITTSDPTISVTNQDP
jgi:hypothetical protein